MTREDGLMSAIPEDFIEKTTQLSEDVTRPFPNSSKIYTTHSENDNRSENRIFFCPDE